MTWTSTFRGAVTIDAEGQMRCFDLVSSTDNIVPNKQILKAPISLFRMISRKILKKYFLQPLSLP